MIQLAKIALLTFLGLLFNSTLPFDSNIRMENKLNPELGKEYRLKIVEDRQTFLNDDSSSQFISRSYLVGYLEFSFLEKDTNSYLGAAELKFRTYFLPNEFETPENSLPIKEDKHHPFESAVSCRFIVSKDGTLNKILQTRHFNEKTNPNFAGKENDGDLNKSYSALGNENYIKKILEVILTKGNVSKTQSWKESLEVDLLKPVNLELDFVLDLSQKNIIRLIGKAKEHLIHFGSNQLHLGASSTFNIDTQSGLLVDGFQEVQIEQPLQLDAKERLTTIINLVYKSDNLNHIAFSK